MQKLNPNDPETMSADIVSENIMHLKAIFPEAFVEGKVDFDVLKQLLGGAVDEREEKYGLNWHGKRKARQLALTPSTGTLRPCPEDSVAWDTTRNLMIEGDNLEVLKLLQKSYAGKIKVIYIDPPYNTGKDYVYPDDFHDNIRNYLRITGQLSGDGVSLTSNTETSGRFHTDWLNMMYPRLMLARDLLSDDGVIFVSIDDSEAANLKHLLVEVFGEDNYIDTLAVEMSTTSGPKTVNAQQGTIVKNVEFVHVFRRSAEFDKRRHTPLLDGIDSYDTHYSLWLREDGTLGTLAEMMLTDEHVAADISRYGFLERDRFSINNLNKLLAVSEATQKFIEANLANIARMDRPPVAATGASTPVGRWEPFEADHRTYYLTTLENGILQALMPLSLNYRLSDDYKPRFGRTVIRGDLWKGFHQDMGNVAKEGDVGYANGKKPVRLIKQLIKWANIKDDELILDFFAGSGTTGQAVMELNADDNAARRFILVQLPEPLDPKNGEQKPAAEFCDQIGKPRFISELTKERLRRAGKKVQNGAPLFTGDIGFRVFKLDTSNLAPWDTAATDVEQSLLAAVSNVKEERTEADITSELLLKLGLDLCVSTDHREIAAKTVQSIGAGALLVCLAPQIDRSEVESLALGIVEWHKDLEPAGESSMVFLDSAFADDVSKTNMTAILGQHGLLKVRSL
ncbi:MAG: site-specific DNA-methyltransferase [Microcystis sp. Msp_OC_L_20101000_S702]|uniref:site-specific DNA-methyltransferase n=1 Tax=Microcystis sp. Msp_OC_L_20101000_S702 TaxID=2486218 RepID=UPI00119720B9|nr:site-specific DNA-methyltransferase [Microcystis sp. Msp_OC_L_20101000_S702]TRU02990.1 MAG: site-specific DNA-methyltransferase [Microcystis sp. Msp_OC_L_20101000_S702]